MSSLSIAALKAKITALILTGGNNTTAAAVRELVEDVVDSGVNRTDDAALLGALNDYDSGANYIAGNGCYYGGKLYRCTTPTTGTFNAAHWTLVADYAATERTANKDQANGYAGLSAARKVPWARSAIERLHNDYTTAANTIGTPEVIASYTVAGGPLAANGERLRVMIGGRFAATANAKTVKLLVNTTQRIALTGSQNGGAFFIQADIVRNADDKLMLCGYGGGDGATIAFAAAASGDIAVTPGAEIALEVEVESTAGEIEVDMMTVDYYQA